MYVCVCVLFIYFFFTLLLKNINKPEWQIIVVAC